MYNVKCTFLSRQFWLFVFLHGGILLSGHSFGEVGISGLDDIRVNAWAGATGDLIGTDTFCSISCRNNPCRNSRHRRTYRTLASTSGVTDGDGNFYITNGTDDLLVYLDWTHPTAGTTRMADFDTTGARTARVPGAISCQDPNSQTAIDIILPAAELARASAGVYSERFRVEICRNNRNCSREVSFSVTLPELIQVTNLKDVSLGAWNGTADLQVTEDFCVFRNGYGGIAIRTNGSNDTAGQFNLSGASTIPYTLEYSQGGGFIAAQPGVTISTLASGFTGESVRDCANVGGTNTRMRISVNAIDIGARSAGNYIDTVIIYVEPD